jgi:hypothetical protein
MLSVSLQLDPLFGGEFSQVNSFQINMSYSRRNRQVTELRSRAFMLAPEFSGPTRSNVRYNT